MTKLSSVFNISDSPVPVLPFMTAGLVASWDTVPPCSDSSDEESHCHTLPLTRTKQRGILALPRKCMGVLGLGPPREPSKWSIYFVVQVAVKLGAHLDTRALASTQLEGILPASGRDEVCPLQIPTILETYLQPFSLVPHKDLGV